MSKMAVAQARHQFQPSFFSGAASLMRKKGRGGGGEGAEGAQGREEKGLKYVMLAASAQGEKDGSLLDEKKNKKNRRYKEKKPKPSNWREGKKVKRGKKLRYRIQKKKSRSALVGKQPQSWKGASLVPARYANQWGGKGQSLCRSEKREEKQNLGKKIMRARGVTIQVVHEQMEHRQDSAEDAWRKLLLDQTGHLERE